MPPLFSLRILRALIPAKVQVLRFYSIFVLIWHQASRRPSPSRIRAYAASGAGDAAARTGLSRGTARSPRPIAAAANDACACWSNS